jgi:predicted transcriptional regulator of viral defense system
MLILTKKRNKMNYVDFYNTLKIFPCFSVREVEIFYPDFDFRRLFEWQKKGYLTKIRNMYYKFNDQNLSEPYLYYIANKIYNPSYISLETALNYYNIIPEGVFTITSVSTLKTTEFHTSSGVFKYRNIKKKLFLGYTILKKWEHEILIATPEKAILDYLYFNSAIEEPGFFVDLRWNVHTIKEIVDEKKLDAFLLIFNSKVLNKRVDLFKKFLYDQLK